MREVRSATFTVGDQTYDVRALFCYPTGAPAEPMIYVTRDGREAFALAAGPGRRPAIRRLQEADRRRASLRYGLPGVG